MSCGGPNVEPSQDCAVNVLSLQAVYTVPSTAKAPRTFAQFSAPAAVVWLWTAVPSKPTPRWSLEPPPGMLPSCQTSPGSLPKLSAGIRLLLNGSPARRGLNSPAQLLVSDTDHSIESVGRKSNTPKPRSRPGFQLNGRPLRVSATARPSVGHEPDPAASPLYGLFSQRKWPPR